MDPVKPLSRYRMCECGAEVHTHLDDANGWFEFGHDTALQRVPCTQHVCPADKEATQ